MDEFVKMPQKWAFYVNLESWDRKEKIELY